MKTGPKPCGWINKSSKRNPVHATVGEVCLQLTKAQHPILDTAGVVRDVVSRRLHSKPPLVPKTSLPGVPEPIGFAGSKTRLLLFPERLDFGNRVFTRSRQAVFAPG